MKAATYNFPAIRRGNTFKPFPIARLNESTPDGAAIPILSAELEVFNSAGTSVIKWADVTMTIAGNQATLAQREPVETLTWPCGDHTYAMKATTAAGTFTYLVGKFPVLDVSKKE